MGKVFIFEHPLIQHKVGMLRDVNTSTKDFRELICEIAMLMAFEATRYLPLEETEIETPICKTNVNRLSGISPAVIPILRAGLGMVEGIINLIPNAKVGHIGLYRDPETHQPVEYYCKLPAEIENRKVFVVDPMLATGGSASAAITMLKERGARDITLMSIIGAPEGIEVMVRDHPDIDIFIAAKDSHLNENAYIVPGLGDAGDRIFGTK